jgi:GT2 family glycosyltransferase
VTPFLSVVTPVYDPPIDVLNDCLASVSGQDSEWEHVLVDDASPSPAVARWLHDAAAADARVRVVRRQCNGGLAAAFNDGVTAATGRFVAFLDHDDRLADGVLAAVQTVLTADGRVDYLYTDEDHISEDGASVFSAYKPDWSPEHFRSHMYTNHLSVVRRSLALDVGGFRTEFDGSEDYDFVLRVTERARRVVHVPVIGYHWRKGERRARPYAFAAGLRAVQDHCDRLGLDATVEMLPQEGYHRLRRRLARRPSVSVVIPTAGAGGIVWAARRTMVVEAVRTLVERSTYPVDEIVVVAGSATSEKVVDELSAIAGDRLVVVPNDHPFNFAETIDIGAAHARGEYLLLLNDDVEVVTSDFLETMLGLAVQPDVGAVGCKLLYADGTIQHAGHVYSGQPMHAFLGRDADEPGPGGLLLVDHEVSGVTAACTLVRAAVFDEVGGLSPNFAVNYNDVDFCLKIRRAGYRIVYTPHAVLYHFESRTRRNVVTDEDRERIRSRWAYELDHDPYHNPNLVPGRDDWTIRYGARCNGLASPTGGAVS